MDDQYVGVGVGAYAAAFGLVTVLIRKGILTREEAQQIFEEATLALEEMGIDDGVMREAHEILSTSRSIVGRFKSEPKR